MSFYLIKPDTSSDSDGFLGGSVAQGYGTRRPLAPSPSQLPMDGNLPTTECARCDVQCVVLSNECAPALCNGMIGWQALSRLAVLTILFSLRWNMHHLRAKTSPLLRRTWWLAVLGITLSVARVPIWASGAFATEQALQGVDLLMYLLPIMLTGFQVALLTWSWLGALAAAQISQRTFIVKACIALVQLMFMAMLLAMALFGIAAVVSVFNIVILFGMVIAGVPLNIVGRRVARSMSNSSNPGAGNAQVVALNQLVRLVSQMYLLGVALAILTIALVVATDFYSDYSRCQLYVDFVAYPTLLLMNVVIPIRLYLNGVSKWKSNKGRLRSITVRPSQA